MKKILCVCILLICLLNRGFAVDDIYERQLDAIEADRLYMSVPEEAKEIELSSDISLTDGLKTVWDKLQRSVTTAFSGGLKCVITIIAVSMLCSAVGAMSAPVENQSLKVSVSLVGAIAVCAAASGELMSIIGMGRELVSNIDTFSKALIPALAAAEAAGGIAGAAVAKAGAAVFFSDILITLINRVMLPMVYAIIFAATANAAVPNESLRRICDLTVKSISGVLKFLLGAFVSYITVAGIVSGSVDKMGLKTAHLAAGAVPVVGGIISQAAETVLAGTALIKNTLGVFGMLVVLSACAAPFGMLAVNYFLFKFTSVCAAPMVGGSIAELTDRFGQCFGLVLAMAASCVVVIFISIIASMKSVGVV